MFVAIAYFNANVHIISEPAKVFFVKFSRQRHQNRHKQWKCAFVATKGIFCL